MKKIVSIILCILLCVAVGGGASMVTKYYDEKTSIEQTDSSIEDAETDDTESVSDLLE